MRSLLFLSLIAAITACSDSGQTTTPVGASQATPAGAVESRQGVQAYGKPQPGPVAFTTVSSVSGPTTGATVVDPGYAIATCPAGTTLISGGYEFDWGQEDARIYYNGPDGANGWKVKLIVVSGGGPASYHPIAMCAQ